MNVKSNSYARVACKTLKYLHDCYENSLEASIDSLNANMFGYFRSAVLLDYENAV